MFDCIWLPLPADYFRTRWSGTICATYRNGEPALTPNGLFHHRQDLARRALVRFVDHLSLDPDHPLIRVLLKGPHHLSGPFDFLFGGLESGIDGVAMVGMDDGFG